MKTKSRLLAMLLAVIMLLSLTAFAFAEDGIEQDLKDCTVILHTNDVHGAIEGYAKVAQLKTAYEARGAYVLLMDAGDFSQGTPYVNISKGAAAVELMNMAGYDLAVPGNHEFDFGFANLQSLEKAAKFPIISANIKYSGDWAFTTSAAFEAPDGAKIGVVGITTPETATKSHPAKIKGVTFLDNNELFSSVQTQVDFLRNNKECSFIVCLGHMGIDDESTGRRSIDVLNKVTGIDLFVDGHSHSTLEDVTNKTNAERKVGSAILTSTGTKLESVGVVTIKDGKIVSSETVALDTLKSGNPEIAAKAKDIISEVDAEYGKVFAKTNVELNGERAPGNRTEETNLGDLITDSMLWLVSKDGGLKVPADDVVAITNGGGIRATIKKGDITKKDVNSVLPFGNTVSVIYVSGEKLLESLEASTCSTPTAIGAFPQIAGMKVTVDTTKTFDQGDTYPGSTYHAPKSINRVTIESINGKPFDKSKTYAVVTNDFLASGGDTYYAFSVADSIIDTGVPLDEALMSYINDELGGVVSDKYAVPAGRITIIKAEGIPEDKPAEQPAGNSTYIVMPGDSLWKIAAELLGDGRAWTKIYEANKDIIKNPSIILIGIVLTIPAK